MKRMFTPSTQSKAERLAAIGRDLYARGWVPATSGNFSTRIDNVSALVTASGKHKGRLSANDFLAVDLQGNPLGNGRPSAETLLHTQLYAWQPWIGTVLHCHSPHATVLSMHNRDDSLELRDYELLKAFRDIDTHETTLSIPIFANTQDIPALAAQVQEHLHAHGNCPAYLIRGHGIYVWGASEEECLRQLEAFDFLLHCELLRLSLPQTTH
ncbi:MAG: methylthioribulose 1-phosphate dehydratase [Spongiibacteraceae bacterium]|jgi:methylthioribulose-1-phosphate dehydratase|nr:methylthioribulose 1-phosphate dehydratase [Spongiibacteraceae bacterium]